jgi:hypothetical protein
MKHPSSEEHSSIE